MNLTNLPRYRLATLPTPLQFAKRLTAELGGPKIFIKRDDLTGLAFGGNKARMLEYLIGDALEQEATHLITEGGPQSNHVRQTLAAGHIASLPVIIVQNPIDPEPDMQGNFLLDSIFGITYHQVETESERGEKMDAIAGELRAAGHHPYIIPGGGSNEVGACGYVAAMLELNNQIWEMSIQPRAMYFASGGGGTQAGIALGAALFDNPFDAIGIAIEDDAGTIASRIWPIIEETINRLGIDFPLDRIELLLNDAHVGPAYAVPTRECIDAIQFLARTESIFLEPIYTAKAFAGMLADIQAGRYSSQDEIIFLHTGGNTVLFALTDQLQPILSDRKSVR